MHVVFGHARISKINALLRFTPWVTRESSDNRQCLVLQPSREHGWRPNKDAARTALIVTDLAAQKAVHNLLCTARPIESITYRRPLKTIDGGSPARRKAQTDERRIIQ